jgi:pimeloyl-ACP methyl ester carboxylesterase
MDLDHPDVSEAVFFPTREVVIDPFSVACPEGTLACRRLTRDPDAGTVLYFHGNGETASFCADYLGDLFLDLGGNACFAEYRGYGASDGTPKLVAMLDDGERVLDALGVPDRRVVVFGRSLGTLYAAELCRRRPDVAGLVLESGIADVVPLIHDRLPHVEIGALVDAARLSFDQQAKLAAYRGPLLVLHTARDGLLDRTHAERLHEWGGGADKQIRVFERGNHNSILAVNLREYRDLLRAFLGRTLGDVETGRSGAV